MTFDEILDRNLDEFFWDVINSRSSFLRNENEEYKEIFTRICEIVDESSLRQYFDQEEARNLSEDEAVLILEYLQCLQDKHVLELKDTFYSALAISKKCMDKFENMKCDLD